MEGFENYLISGCKKENERKIIKSELGYERKH
jgi:hypothetical protein